MQPEGVNYEFFYSTRSPFSQFHPCVFRDKSGKVFQSAEQYMMYSKAMLFDDFDAADKIARTTNCAQIKALGRGVRGFDEKKWAANREAIVAAGNLYKFRQNPHLLAALLATGDRTLVEASPTDRIWGIGMREEEARTAGDHHWRGQNLLGKILTQIKRTLQSEAQADMAA
jgi:ribA/ribD-fused uncharacterized protein